MKKPYFEYIIVGAGTSGLHLIKSITEDKFFKEKKILLIDKSLKNNEEKCFSFWEKGKGKWDKIITKSWSNGHFISKDHIINLDLKDYKYKMIKSKDFNKYVKKIISSHSNIKITKDDVINIRKENNQVVVVANKTNYICEHVFDSRFPNDINLNNHISIKQHFKGWIIETKAPRFDSKTFTIMDYRIRDINKTAFTYVLPISNKKALIEYTYFTKELVDSKEYDLKLKKYIKKILEINDYSILNEEYGIIPMTNYPFFNHSTDNITKIGTAGGWVKPSTGYSFKNSERNSKKIVRQLKKNITLINVKSKLKYYHMDKIFLDVLEKNNWFGEKLFSLLFKKNSANKIFEFLDEKSNFFSELKIIKSLFSIHFIKSFIRHLFNGLKVN